VQANFTALQPTAQGFASLWDTGNWPGTSSLNYTPAVAEIANFTQTLIGPDLKIRLKTQQPAQYIIDIVGLVVQNPFAQIASGSAVAGLRAQIGEKIAAWQRRPQ